MKKRLRKKLRIKEYAKQGFRVIIQFDKERVSSEIKKLVDDFLTFTIEENRLSCGGYSDENQSEMFITTIKGVSANENHRLLIDKWLKKRQDIPSYSVGQLEKAKL